MNAVKRKLSSVLIETAHKDINALEPQSVCAKELSKIKDVDAVIAETVEKICQAATLAEISFFLLTARLKATSGQKREAIKSQLKKIAEEVLKRVESQAGPLSLPQTCRHLLLEL